VTLAYTLGIIVTIILYGHLDKYYAFAGETCDDKFLRALDDCDPQRMTARQRSLIQFMDKNFESRHIGFCLLLALISRLPINLFSLIRPEDKDKNDYYEPLCRAVYFWSLSHLYRNTIIGILGSLLLSLYKAMLVFEVRRVPELIDGHAETGELYHANQYIMERHTQKLAA
jgi:hypothetical protein